MDTLSPSHPARRIVFMKSAQVGATTAGDNWLGYIIHLSPGPVIAVQPTIELAERASKQRIGPMLEDTPELAAIIPAARSRDSGNTIRVKEFPGGILVLAGANAAAGLRSMAARYAYLDEVDAYPDDLDDEGDPVSLVARRIQTFGRFGKMFLVSTPKVKGESRIEREFEASDQRRYFVPCPHCHELQWLKFERLKWEKGRPETVVYSCEHCGADIHERDKASMLPAGEWQATATSTDAGLIGFHISALYSPLGWVSWVEIAREWEAATTDEAIKTFVNTVKGETWQPTASTTDPEKLRQRVESYDDQCLPARVKTVTFGADTQDNWIEVTRIGWCEGEEAFVARHDLVYGDTSKPDVWREFDDLIRQPLKTEDGRVLQPRAGCIDSGGHRGDMVFWFCNARRARRIYPIKGKGNLPGITTPIWPQKIKRTRDTGKKPFIVGVDTAKDTLSARLQIVPHQDVATSYAIHFPANGLSADYFEQLTSEHVMLVVRNKVLRRIWDKKTREARNEAWDCLVYALAALRSLPERLDRKLLTKMSTETNEPNDPKEPEVEPAPPVSQDSDPPPPPLPTDPSRKERLAARRRLWTKR